MPTEPGALVISLDVDLAWGSDAMAVDERSLAALRRILDLLEQREIHATWAIVGLAFARDCQDALDFAARLPPSSRVHQLLASREPDVEPQRYFAPELISTIAARPHQEIATLTFSGGAFSGGAAAYFEADLAAAIAIAERDFAPLRSLVFPGDRSDPELLPILARHGIGSYRGARPGWAYRPTRFTRLGAALSALRTADNFSLLIPDVAISIEDLVDPRRGRPLEIPVCRSMRAFDPRLAKLEPLRVHRMQSEMMTAAEAGRLYHLCLRPLELGAHLHENLAMLDGLLRTARALAGSVGFRSVTMSELSELAVLSSSGCR
jgi:hypothetical protein